MKIASPDTMWCALMILYTILGFRQMLLLVL